MSKLNNLFGRKFNELAVGDRAENDKRGRAKWNCVCSCGNKLIALGSHILSGNTKSCGCLQKKRAAEVKSVHGFAASPEYHAWKNMHDRCTNPKNAAYHNYGGRGITVCDQWVDLLIFIADMGRRTSSLHSLDRIDNNGNYEPGNCRWATWHEQQNNRRKRQ